MYRYLTLIFLISIIYGCNSSSRPNPEPIKVDEEGIFQGTIGSLCELIGYQAVKVQGYSLVIGLAGTGSSGCPAPVRTYLVQDLRRLKDQGFLPSAYMDLSIEKIIDHDSTSVVRVSGMVSAGSLKGDRFDVEVTALEGTQTTSLQGGRLVRSQLQVVVPGYRGRPVASRPTALAYGHIFVNPFSVKQGEVLKVDPRRGMVLGGGRATYDRQIRLSLLRPDYRKAQLIQNRINSRFQSVEDKKIAEATGRGSIILRAPKAYRDRYSHFISLVWGLYLQGSPGYLERKLMELMELARDPEADMEAISIAWEGIGRPALPKLYPIYQDVSSGKAAYYAARTALNLEDRKAIDAMIKMALDDTHPYQMLAAQSLSEYPNDLRGRAALLQLLKKDNYRLRLLAYEGLRKGKDIAIRSGRKLGEGFTIDEAPGSGEPIVAVWATKNPRIVILGEDLKCRSNLFYSSADEKVTLNARPGDASIGIHLTMPRNMGYVSRKSSFEVRELIEELARPVENKDGNVIGPGLCFSEIVGILYAFCKDDMIPARFTMHRIAEDLTG